MILSKAWSYATENGLRKQEAEYIGNQLLIQINTRLGDFSGINIGAGDQRKLRVSKPWIYNELWRKLLELGVCVQHTDFKCFEGIDELLDLNDPDLEDRILDLCQNKRPLLFLCNVLEHLPPPVLEKVIVDIPAILEKHKGVLVCSVPYHYPYHADPIDNGFRPSPALLERLMRVPVGCSTCTSITAGSFSEEFMEMGFFKRLRVCFRPLWPFCGLRRYRERVSRLAFFGRPYLITVMIADYSRENAGAA